MENPQIINQSPLYPLKVTVEELKNVDLLQNCASPLRCFQLNDPVEPVLHGVGIFCIEPVDSNLMPKLLIAVSGGRLC